MTLIVPVDKLEVGMYVAQLDRPWLETPFLFQGFYIRTQDEIDEIRAHCEHVHVSHDGTLADMDPISRPPSIHVSRPEAEPRKQRRFRWRQLFKPSEPDPEPVQADPSQSTVIYQETTTLKGEMRNAAGAHQQARIALRGVMDELRRSGNLDLGSLEMAVSPMVDSVLRNPAALACLVRLQQKNDYLYHHSLASSVWAAILGRQIGLSRDDLVVVALGAMLLDVGKTKLPTALLSKPGKLTAEERQLVERHVEFGLQILGEAASVDERVLDMVAHHHERHNGTGYPAGLNGNTIPVFGRLAGIVDAYDAMITPRPYATLMSSYDALRKLRMLADVEFQAEIVEQLTRAIGVFPTGTLVELNTGEVAIVTRQNSIRRLRPEIMLIMDSDKQLLDDFRIVNLNDETVTLEGAQSMWIEFGLPPGAHGIDPTEFYLD